MTVTVAAKSRQFTADKTGKELWERFRLHKE